MRLSQMVGQRLKDAPRDAQTASHIFLIRGGYCRPVSTGIYSMLPIGQRVIAKIEAIIREEMNRIDGQEIKMPVVLPADLWRVEQHCRLAVRARFHAGISRSTEERFFKTHVANILIAHVL